MALPLGIDQASSRNLSSITPIVVDWAQEQSRHDQPSNDAIRLPLPHSDGKLSRADEAKQARPMRTDHSALRQGRCQSAKKVYDIATLLSLKDTQSAVPVMLRVKPEAIAENIFQYMGAATSRRLPTRSQGLSDISNISTGAAGTHSHSIHPAAAPKYINQPVRQPHAPPETSILQRHDGFARFLKQHASPPHHRVTAGGRIVPAGPSSPPPMLDFGSLNELLKDRPATAKSIQKESRLTLSDLHSQNSQATSSMTLGDYLQSQGGSIGGVSLQHPAQPTPVQTATPVNNLPFGYQSFMAPAMQTQGAMVPLAMFPDGSTLVSYNGINYRASWNGMNTTMEPLQPIQLPIDQQYYSHAYLQGSLNSPLYGIVPQPTQPSIPSIPPATATNVAQSNISKADRSLQHQSQDMNELGLKTELTNLDKHLALYHHEIVPADRASLIAHRRCLVEELDKIRLSKEKPKHSIPIIAPAATGLPVTPAGELISGTNGLHEAVQVDRVTKGGTTNKHLSPAAPAFVPRNAPKLDSTYLGMRPASQQAKHQHSGMRALFGGVDSTLKTKNNANSSTRTIHPDLTASSPRTQAISHNEVTSSSSVLDPSDPAMRVIDYEDIEYAARYMYNWTKDTKTYCTTVAEFQEAVRRVREQAKQYGCAGGQSKDPAYDAEQDLWWAICDRDPIPLPSKVPDHVVNPRPWNWNDSAFNYRRRGANDAPGPGCEHARNSPRVIGWDPATTDKMKDVTDVSRSYFALKGQLPSVSFRDFVYDQGGNKRLIQSDTAVPTAYATAPNTTARRDKSSMADSQQAEFSSSFESSALKRMSTNELNIQHTGLALDARTEPADPEKAPGGSISPQKAPCTPERSRIQWPLEASNVHSTTQTSKPHLSVGFGITRSKIVETSHGPHHAYIENYAETPAAAGIKSASTGAGLSHQMKTPPSKAYKSTLPAGGGDATTRAGSPLPAYVGDSIVIPGSSRKATEEELNSIWYQTPLDEVTQMYLDDMKAYNPFKNKRADENIYDESAAKNHGRAPDSSEPVTESKSPWGPEESATPTTRSGSHRFESLEIHGHGLAKKARVNIPSANTIRAPIPRINGRDTFSMGSTARNALDSHEFNAVNIPSAQSNSAHNFLRKMLKSPRYSSAQPMSIFSQIGSTLVDKINEAKRTQTDSTKTQTENLGKSASNKHTNTGIIGSGRHDDNSRPSNSASLARANPNLAVSKAQSSLASSTYQAHACLPLFDGAGKAHTSSVYREQGIQPLPQVRLPSEALCGSRQHATKTSDHEVHGPNAYTASMTYHNSVNFGYDGGRDSPPPKTTNNPIEKQSSRPTFDTMGLTLADYDNQREDTNNAWHHGAVEDFFQDLREQELKTIASHQSVNT